jgi:tetratricopeptide (TPR) repeat protein
LATNYPLTLGEITVAGLTGLGARCRIAAEMDVRESPLFDQFVVAVRNKGFFRDPDTEVPKRDPEEEKERLARAAEIHEERLRKVMGKVKEKLAHKAQQQLDDNVGDVPPLYHDHFVMSAAERLERRRRTHLRQGNGETTATTKRKTAPPPPPPRPPSTTPVQYQSSTSQSSPTSSPEQLAQRSFSSKARQESSVRANMPSPDIVLKETLSMDNPGLQRVTSSTITSPVTNTKQTSPPPPRDASASPHQTTDKDAADVEQAERLKAIGNAHMQKKKYALAAGAYTAALVKSPNGPHAHVYYSNRAAALLSMKRFDEAISDSECSLALKPDYGKAHARLGLAHFLLGNYQLAVEAYTTSLKYEPDNKSTKNYLDKATKRAAAIEAAASQNQHEQSVKKSSNPGLPMPKQENEERNMKVREKEAEKVKLKGNSYMANRDYEAALTNYTLAIKLSPEGPNSHVYYSNRAAALCYLERYEEAEADSEYSLRLNPTYGKAHARLGLSRFFMGDYAGAIEAYQSALEYDPDNAASKSYLQKAKARLAKQGGGSEARLKKAAVASSPVPPGSKDSFDEIMNATPDKTTAAEI